MPAVLGTAQKLGAPSAITPTYNAASASGHEFVNDGKTHVHVVNADASPTTATFVTQQTISGLAVADQAVTVPAGEERIIGPFPKGLFDDSNGKVQFSFTNVTNVTFVLVTR